MPYFDLCISEFTSPTNHSNSTNTLQLMDLALDSYTVSKIIRVTLKQTILQFQHGTTRSHINKNYCQYSTHKSTKRIEKLDSHYFSMYNVRIGAANTSAKQAVISDSHREVTPTSSSYILLSPQDLTSLLKAATNSMLLQYSPFLYPAL